MIHMERKVFSAVAVKLRLCEPTAADSPPACQLDFMQNGFQSRISLLECSLLEFPGIFVNKFPFSLSYFELASVTSNPKCPNEYSLPRVYSLIKKYS